MAFKLPAASSGMAARWVIWAGEADHRSQTRVKGPAVHETLCQHRRALQVTVLEQGTRVGGCWATCDPKSKLQCKQGSPSRRTTALQLSQPERASPALRQHPDTACKH